MNARTMPRSKTAARFACLAVVTMLSLASTGRDGRACGYHDDVSIARGTSTSHLGFRCIKRDGINP